MGWLYPLMFFMLGSPLGLDWDKKHTPRPEIPGYKYYYGSVDWGTIVYLGKGDILGAETELQVEYLSKKIARASLILGPSGLNSYNCIAKYKSMVELLDTKYGKHKYVHEVKDPLYDDLVMEKPCDAISLGLREVRTYWITPDYSIEAIVIGEDYEFFIEITYTNLRRTRKMNKNRKRKVLKKL